MGHLRFREATATEADTVLAIKQTAIKHIDGDCYDETQLAAWRPDDDAVDVFEQAIEDDQFNVVIAEYDDQPAGYGVLSVVDNRIDAIFVRPDYSRSGIASSLVGQLEMRARMYDISELEIVSSLNATAFYESLGYFNFGTQQRTIEGVDIEFTVMRKQLNGE